MPKLTIEEARAFVTDAKKARSDWLSCADRSWAELKKRQKNGKLFSNTPNSVRVRQKYPLWYSIFKIRQPLILSRVGVPVGRDTTQDGNDTVAATAALCLERLATNLARAFDFFDVMCAARDDFLATNFANVRAYYEREEIKEQRREYITPQTDEASGEVVFVDSEGNIVVTDAIAQDEQGYFIETEELVDVENEKVCLEPVLYKDMLIDPDVRRYSRVKRMAFVEHYSEREFAEVFGRKALSTLPHDEDGLSNEDAKKKRNTIVVYEYWDMFERECYWFAENGEDFIRPKNYINRDDEEYGEAIADKNGPYDLEHFFPCPPPLVINQPTDDFWPVPEFYQLQDLFDEIHSIFSRMVLLTRAIRSRILYDSNVEGLQAALNELSEADAIGVPNLAQALSGVGGRLDAVVQYIPVGELIAGLQQMYGGFEQRLNVIYKLTGTSDLLQGFVTDQTNRTFGERQMQEKYALNQQADSQQKMQEFVRASYELLVEMALKNFKDDSLVRYIIPQTLPPDHREQFPQAMELLKNKRKRFRIELETDSTIAINEEYDKARAIELANTLTAALEKVAGIAQSQPALVIPELHALKFLIQSFRQGKMFQNEITASIDQIIKAQEAMTEKPFDKDQMAMQLKREEMEFQRQLQQYKVQSDERIEVAKLQQAQSTQAFEAQLAQFKLQQEASAAATQAQLEAYKVQSQQAQSSAEMQMEYERLRADIAQQQQMLQLRSDQLVLELRKLVDEKDATQFQQMLDARVAEYDMQLRAAKQQIEAVQTDLDLKERVMTEQRLQQEHQLQQLTTALDMQKQRTEMIATAATPPVVQVQMPTPKTTKTIKAKRNESGLVDTYEVSEMSEG